MTKSAAPGHDDSRAWPAARRWCTRANRRLVAASAACTASTVAQLCAPLALKIFMDEAVLKGEASAVALGAVGLGALSVLALVMGACGGALFASARETIVEDVRREVYLGWLATKRAAGGGLQDGQLIAAYSKDAPAMARSTVGLLEEAPQAALRLTGSLVILVNMYPVVALLAAGAAVISAAASAVMTRRVAAAAAAAASAEGAMSGALLVRLAAWRDIVTYDAVRVTADALARQASRAAETARELAAAKAGLQLTGLSYVVAAAVTYWSAGIHVVSGALSLGEFLALFRYVSMVQQPAGMATSLAGEWEMWRDVTTRLARIGAWVSDGHVAAPVAELRSDAGLAVNEVTVRGDSDESVLTAASVHVARGEKVCVVGTNGAGKSTLLGVAAGLVRPTQGCVTFGAQPIEPGNSRDWACRRGAVLQDSRGIEGTTVENIVLGRPVSEEHASAAAVRCGLDPSSDNWARLTASSGERLRLALARAIVTQPEVLLLDEPTSNLDSEGRLLVAAAMKDVVKRDGAVMWTSHSRDEAMTADRVVWLHGGRVVADGAPEELMKMQAFCDFWSHRDRGDSDH